MTWFGAFMLKGIGVCVILSVIATIAGFFIKDYDEYDETEEMKK